MQFEGKLSNGVTGIKVYYSASQITSTRKTAKRLLFKKVFLKGHCSEICNFILTYDFFGVKTVRNNDEPSEYQPGYMQFEGKLSNLLARLLLVLLIYI